MTTNRILLTGATGFIGSALADRLRREGFLLRIVTRQGHVETGSDTDDVVANLDLTTSPIPDSAMAGVSTVVHLAHDMTASDGDAGNLAMAKHVGEACAKSGCQRLIYRSSIAAQEAAGPNGRTYGHGKLAIETKLTEAFGADPIILRPPAVYGPGMAGALATLGKLIDKNLPLPLGSARTARPYIYIETLIDLIAEIVKTDQATYDMLAADGPLVMRDPKLVDTATLIRWMAQAKGRSATLVPVPPALLRLLGRMTGKSLMVSRTLDPVPCETSPALHEVLHWSATRSMPETLDFLSSSKS